jgi:hypothetical protein
VLLLMLMLPKAPQHRPEASQLLLWKAVCSTSSGILLLLALALVPPASAMVMTLKSSRAAYSGNNSNSSCWVGRMQIRCTLRGGGGGPVKPEASVAEA